MTNADFRKMMMTPRTSGPATLGPLGSGSSTPSMTPKDDKGKNSCNNGTTKFFSCPEFLQKTNEKNSQFLP